MSDQTDNVSLISSNQPPDVLRLRDADGQPWAITVRADGQLQTAKWPDGEPIRFVREMSLKDMTDTFYDVMADSLESLLQGPSLEELQSRRSEFERVLDNPDASDEYKRVVGKYLLPNLDKEIEKAKTLRVKGQ